MRYLPLTPEERQQMLAVIGVSSMDDIYAQIPAQVQQKSIFNLPAHQGEIEVESFIKNLASKNKTATSQPFFLGAGCYFHHIPATVDYILQRSEFLTSYTPYQPEIAQGTLNVIFEFQTMIARLTGMDIANASMYDGATATAEAVLMSMRIKKDRNKIIIANPLHPQYAEVLTTYLRNLPDSVVEQSTDANLANIDEKTACVIVQYPDFYGNPTELENYREACSKNGALLIVVVNEIVSLGLLPAPDCADIVVGEAQSIGVPMSFGGPHLGFFACKKEFVRQMPGRLCGITTDANGERSFVLTLNTREQHIRREKATSNICTNQGLMALGFTVHLSLLGEVGFKKLALINHQKACQLADILGSVKNVKLANQNFFNEFTIELPKPAKVVSKALTEAGIIGGFATNDNRMIVAATELTSEDSMKKLADALGKITN